jgi:hypothetical protein
MVCAATHANASHRKRVNGAAFAWSRCAGGTVWIVETARPLAPFYIEGIVPPLKEQVAVDRGFAPVFNYGESPDCNHVRAVRTFGFASELERRSVT